jgi:enoyl-CoA hydratase/carnithine racemase
LAVSLTVEGNVGLIRLNRPPVNSYDFQFNQELGAAIDEARMSEDARVIVLASELPKFFSAGADVNVFRSNTPTYQRGFVAHANETFSKLERTHKLCIAAINGHCLGGGYEIALCCDLRFAGDGEFKVGLPEANLGLLPGTGGTQRLPRLIGRSKALELMVTGASVSPKEALELGLVDKLFPPDELMDRTLEFARKVAEGPYLAGGAIKLSVVQGTDESLEGGLAIEHAWLNELFRTEDAQEGMAALFEKRKASFKGR